MLESVLLFGTLIIRVGPRWRSEYELFEAFFLAMLIIENKNCMTLGLFNFLKSALGRQDDVSTQTPPYSLDFRRYRGPLQPRFEKYSCQWLCG